MNGWLISVWLDERQLDLGLFGRFLETLQRHLVLGQVDAVLLFELVGEVVHDPHVEVFTAEERVPVGGFHLEQAVVDFEDGDVEGAAAKVIDRDRARFLLVEAIGERGCRRLVDDAQHFEAGDLAGVLGGLALGVVEIGGHGDDGLRHVLAEIAFGGFLHLCQDEGGDLRGAVFLALHLDPGVAIAAVDDLVGHVLLVLWTSASPTRRPIRRLTAKMVFSGLVTACRLAGWPTRRSSSVKATMDGVVRAPSEFSMTRGWLPSMMATQEFVVPRSIPITLHAMQRRRRGWHEGKRSHRASSRRAGVARVP
jgi:hypothetical protein